MAAASSSGSSSSAASSSTSSPASSAGPAKLATVPETSLFVRTHAHVLEFSVMKGWNCDGRHQPGGCQSGITTSSQTDNVILFRCQHCDYKECLACAQTHRSDDPLLPQLQELGWRSVQDDPLDLLNADESQQTSFMEKMVGELSEFAKTQTRFESDSTILEIAKSTLKNVQQQNLTEALACFVSKKHSSNFLAPSLPLASSRSINSAYATTIDRLLQSLKSMSNVGQVAAGQTGTDSASGTDLKNKKPTLDPVLICFLATFELLLQSIQINYQSGAATQIVAVLSAYAQQLPVFCLQSAFDDAPQKRDVLYSCIQRLSLLLGATKPSPELFSALFPLYLATGSLPSLVVLVNWLLRDASIAIPAALYQQRLSQFASLASELCSFDQPASSSHPKAQQTQQPTPPNCWDPSNTSDAVKLVDYKNVVFEANASISRRAVARKSWPAHMFPGSPQDVFYYEILIEELAPDSTVYIGLVDHKNPGQKTIGQYLVSYAFSSGGVYFSGNPNGRKYGDAFVVGDTIGCGYNPARFEVFFTKNGQNLGVAQKRLSGRLGNLFPAVAIVGGGSLKTSWSPPFVYVDASVSLSALNSLGTEGGSADDAVCPLPANFPTVPSCLHCSALMTRQADRALRPSCCSRDVVGVWSCPQCSEIRCSLCFPFAPTSASPADESALEGSTYDVAFSLLSIIKFLSSAPTKDSARWKKMFKLPTPILQQSSSLLLSPLTELCARLTALTTDGTVPSETLVAALSYIGACLRRVVRVVPIAGTTQYRYHTTDGSSELIERDDIKNLRTTLEHLADSSNVALADAATEVLGQAFSVFFGDSTGKALTVMLQEFSTQKLSSGREKLLFIVFSSLNFQKAADTLLGDNARNLATFALSSGLATTRSHLLSATKPASPHFPPSLYIVGTTQCLLLTSSPRRHDQLRSLSLEVFSSSAQLYQSFVDASPEQLATALKNELLTSSIALLLPSLAASLVTQDQLGIFTPDDVQVLWAVFAPLMALRKQQHPELGHSSSQLLEQTVSTLVPLYCQLAQRWTVGSELVFNPPPQGVTKERAGALVNSPLLTHVLLRNGLAVRTPEEEEAIDVFVKVKSASARKLWSLLCRAALSRSAAPFGGLLAEHESIDEMLRLLVATVLKHTGQLDLLSAFLNNAEEGSVDVPIAIRRIHNQAVKIKTWFMQKRNTAVQGLQNEQEHLDSGPFFEDLSREVSHRCSFLLSFNPCLTTKDLTTVLAREPQAESKNPQLLHQQLRFNNSDPRLNVFNAILHFAQSEEFTRADLDALITVAEHRTKQGAVMAQGLRLYQSLFAEVSLTGPLFHSFLLESVSVALGPQADACTHHYLSKVWPLPEPLLADVYEQLANVLNSLGDLLPSTVDNPVDLTNLLRAFSISGSDKIGVEWDDWLFCRTDIFKRLLNVLDSSAAASKLIWNTLLLLVQQSLLLGTGRRYKVPLRLRSDSHPSDRVADVVFALLAAPAANASDQSAVTRRRLGLTLVLHLANFEAIEKYLAGPKWTSFLGDMISDESWKEADDLYASFFLALSVLLPLQSPDDFGGAHTAHSIIDFLFQTVVRAFVVPLFEPEKDRELPAAVGACAIQVIKKLLASDNWRDDLTGRLLDLLAQVRPSTIEATPVSLVPLFVLGGSLPYLVQGTRVSFTNPNTGNQELGTILEANDSSVRVLPDGADIFVDLANPLRQIHSVFEEESDIISAGEYLSPFVAPTRELWPHFFAASSSPVRESTIALDTCRMMLSRMLSNFSKCPFFLTALADSPSWVASVIDLCASRRGLCVVRELEFQLVSSGLTVPSLVDRCALFPVGGSLEARDVFGDTSKFRAAKVVDIDPPYLCVRFDGVEGDANQVWMRVDSTNIGACGTARRSRRTLEAPAAWEAEHPEQDFRWSTYIDSIGGTRVPRSAFMCGTFTEEARTTNCYKDASYTRGQGHSEQAEQKKTIRTSGIQRDASENQGNCLDLSVLDDVVMSLPKPEKSNPSPLSPLSKQPHSSLLVGEQAGGTAGALSPTDNTTLASVLGETNAPQLIEWLEFLSAANARSILTNLTSSADTSATILASLSTPALLQLFDSLGSGNAQVVKAIKNSSDNDASRKFLADYIQRLFDEKLSSNLIALTEDKFANGEPFSHSGPEGVHGYRVIFPSTPIVKKLVFVSETSQSEIDLSSSQPIAAVNVATTFTAIALVDDEVLAASSDRASSPTTTTTRTATTASPTSVPTSIKIGMRLEAVDIKTTNYICVATITDIDGGNVRVHFDGWGENWDYWCSATHKNLGAPGSCTSMGHTLQAPRGFSGTFEWPAYLEQVGGEAYPDQGRPIQTPSSWSTTREGTWQITEYSRSSGETDPTKIEYEASTETKENFDSPNGNIYAIAFPLLDNLPRNLHTPFLLLRRFRRLLLPFPQILASLFRASNLLRGKLSYFILAEIEAYLLALSQQPKALKEVLSERSIRRDLLRLFVFSAKLFPGSAERVPSSHGRMAARLASSIHNLLENFSRALFVPIEAPKVEDHRLSPLWWLKVNDGSAQPDVEGEPPVPVNQTGQAQETLVNDFLRVDWCSHGQKTSKPARNILINSPKHIFTSDDTGSCPQVSVLIECQVSLALFSFSLRRNLQTSAAGAGYLLVSDERPTYDQIRHMSEQINREQDIGAWYNANPGAAASGLLRPVGFWSFLEETGQKEKTFGFAAQARETPESGIRCKWIVLTVLRTMVPSARLVHIDFAGFYGWPFHIQQSLAVKENPDTQISASQGFVSAALLRWPPRSGSSLVRLASGTELARFEGSGNDVTVDGQAVSVDGGIAEGWRTVLVRSADGQIQYYVDARLIASQPAPAALQSPSPITQLGGADVAKLVVYTRAMANEELNQRIFFEDFAGHVGLGTWPAVPWERVASGTPKNLAAGVWEITTGYPTIRATHGLQTGRFYYELSLDASRTTAGRVGFVNLAVGFSATKGVGDDPAGFGFDGETVQRVSAGQSVPYGEKWQAGDVIGCYIDLVRQTIGFSRNGVDLGIAFTDIAQPGTQAWYPAWSFQPSCTVHVNLGSSPWKYPPALGYIGCAEFIRPAPASTSAVAASSSGASSSSSSAPSSSSVSSRIPDLYVSYFDKASSALPAAVCSSIEEFARVVQLIRSFADRTNLPRWFRPGYPRKHDLWTLHMDIQLVSLIQDTLGSRNPSDFNPQSLELTDSLKEAYTSISSLPIDEIRERAMILKEFNTKVSAVFRLLDLGSSEVTGYLHEFLKLKQMLFKSGKFVYLDQLLNLVDRDGSTPPVDLRRLSNSFAHGDKNSYRHTIFGQLFRQLKKKAPSFWMRSKTDRSWKANFVGEYSYDAGGPYRESMSLWCDELGVPEKLSIVVWTPNHVANTGLNKDCVLLNPKATHPIQLDMLEFLGRLIGACFFNRHPLPLRFPSVFWKQLVQDPLTLEDLKDIDSIGYQQLSDFNYYIPEEMTFETNLPDGSIVELIPGGKKIPVNESNIKRYLELAAQAKLNASAQQMAALMHGLAEVVPVSLLRLFSWQEIQEFICGTPDFDVDSLRSGTDVHSDLKGTPSETHFWNTLKGFTPAERVKFLKFAWGQGTYPEKGSPAHKSMTLQMLSSSDPARAYPTSATCFFKVSIPKYPDEESCRRQLLYAINNCVSIDADGSVVTAQASSDDEEPEGL